MCGVIGYWPLDLGKAPEARQLAFHRLFEESCIRGLHAYGLSDLREGGKLRTFKTHNRDKILEQFDPSLPTIAHTRYCQSGDWRVLENNQPIMAAGMALVFNGVIHMGTKEEFEAAFDVKCDADNDGEVFLRRLEKRDDPAVFLSQMTGSFAGLWLTEKGLYAGRNPRRPLWRNNHLGAVWYGSTRDIFLRAGFPEPEEVIVNRLAVVEFWGEVV